MHCEEKAALTAAREKATRAYIEAVADLCRAVGAAVHADWGLLQRKAAPARKLSNDASSRLKQHQHQHNC
jgi:hypothetical protein